MADTTNNYNKRLAKNTFMLYIRSFLVMALGLYTSRVVLQALGVNDYGIYNIVGGFVSLFGLVSGTLVSTTQRYLNFELGKTDNSDPQKIFATAMCIHIVLAIFLFILLESIGLWFLNNELNIPSARLTASNWVFQFAVLSFLINIISMPYNAVIIAHEKMSAFAYISILEAVLKFIVAYLLCVCAFDRLVIYAFLLTVVAALIRVIYQVYCKRNFAESKFSIVTDSNSYKEMLGFAGMNFIGAAASLLSNHGINIILNIFFGVSINAARGIAVQVQHATSKFVTDFMTALNPQITKEYAAGNYDLSKQLCFRGSKFSFFLMLMLSLPLLIRMPDILELWLGVVPDFAIEFSRFTLVLSLCTLLSNALITEILATGNLTSTTFWIGGIRILTLPIACVFFALGFPPAYSYYTLIGIEIVSLFTRLVILEKITNSDFVIDFFRVVGKRVLIVSSISLAMALLIDKFLSGGFIYLIVYIALVMSSTIIAILILGLSSHERSIIVSFITNKLKK